MLGMAAPGNSGPESKQRPLIYKGNYGKITAVSNSSNMFIIVRMSVNLEHRLRIVIVISKLLKRHSKAKRRAPAYLRALRQIRGVFQRIVRGGSGPFSRL